MTTILGIDPGTARCGYGVIVGEGTAWQVVTCGCITTPAGLPPAARLSELYGDLTTLLARHTPSVVCVESLFFQNNQKTALSVAEARGVVLLAAAQSGVAIHELTPMQVKSAITGYGHATKQQVQAMVQRVFQLDAIPQPDDAADALAIAYGATSFQVIR